MAISNPNSTSPDCEGNATSDVFNITELLEAILKDVPFETLLLSQRVSKRWRATIRGSRRLQQKLFLTPAEPECVWKHDLPKRPEADRLYHPIDAELVLANPEQRRVLQATLNPLVGPLQSAFPRTVDQRALDGEQVEFETSIVHSHVAREDKDPSKHWHASTVHDSYLDMFVCQPPVKGVFIDYLACVETARSETGVKFGHILEVCNRIRGRVTEEFVCEVEATYRYTGMIEKAHLVFPGLENGQVGPTVLFEPIGEWSREDPGVKSTEAAHVGCGEVR